MTRAQFRAVFLAAVMVLSVVAMGAGFAGSAAAQEAPAEGEVVLLNQSDDVVGSFDSIQAAVDAASEENDTVVVGPGSYDSFDINIDGLTIEGPNAGVAGDSDDRGEEAVVSLDNDQKVIVTASNVKIDGLAFEFAENAIYSASGSSDSLYTNNRLELTDGKSSNGYALRVEGDTAGTDVVDNLFVDVESTDGIEGDNVNGIVVRDPSDAKISGNVFNNVDTGVNVGDDSPAAGELVVADNEFANISQYGAVAVNNGDSELNVEVRNNTINSSSVGIAVYNADSAAKFSIQNNTFGNFDAPNPYVNDGFVEVLDLDQIETSNEFTPDAVVGATAITPMPGVNTVLNADTRETYSDIQSAVDNAGEGDTIAVGSGTYEESISISTDNLSIKGPNAGVAGDSGERGAEAELTVTDGVISGENVTIDGLLFSGASSDFVEITESGTAFENNRFETDGTASVRLKPEATNTAISSNLFNGSGGNWVINSHQGDAPIEGVEVTDNTFRNAEGSVIQAKYTNGIISQNSFENIDEDAIRLVGDLNGVEVKNNTIQNTGLDQENASTPLLSGIVIVDAAGDYNISNNKFRNNPYHIVEFSDPNSPTLEGNEFDNEVNVDRTEVATDYLAGQIDDAVAFASEGATVTAEPGTYKEDVTVNTANVSLVGFGDETVIHGQISLNAKESSVSDLRVTSADPVNTSSNTPVVLVQASNTSVERLQIDGISGDGANSLDVIQVYNTDETPVSDVFIYNNTIEDIESDGVVGVSGIKAQGSLDEIFIVENEIDTIHSEGWAYGVVTTPSGNAPNQKVSNVVVNSNSIENVTADEYAGVGVGVDTESGDPGTDGGPANETFVSLNTVQNNDIALLNKDVENTLFARYNYFGADAPTIQGDIVYDPFLTVEPDELDAESPDELRDFGHDLVVPADGEPHSVAFPAPVEGNVSEVFGEFNGTVYAYDGDEWKSGEEVADQDIDALDAFAVSVDEGEEDLRIDFAYAETDSPVPSMTTAELEQGWNFVGAPSGNAPSSEAFAGSTADITTVIDAIAGPESSTTPYGLDASGEVTNPSRVSPFKGYWVFVTDDGELGATVPVDPTQETEEGALTGR